MLLHKAGRFSGAAAPAAFSAEVAGRLWAGFERQLWLNFGLNLLRQVTGKEFPGCSFAKQVPELELGLRSDDDGKRLSLSR